MKGKILVTGAGGFIGSHLTKVLVRNGFSVRAFLRYNAKSDIGNLKLLPEEILKKIEIFFGDVRDFDTVKRAVRGCKYVFHLAALISVPYSYDAPRSFFDTNVLGAMNVFQAALDKGVERVVVMSTSEVYGTAKKIPITEDHPICAQSPYAASKIAADKLAESFHLTYYLPVTIIRPFNTYGQRQSARAVIPNIILQALDSSSIKLGFADSMRDFLFVYDTVPGIIECGLAKNTVGETLNLATSRGASIKEIVQIVGKILGKKLRIVNEKGRMRPKKSEVIRLIGSYKRAKQLCGWEPKISLEEGLEKTIVWIKENKDFYKMKGYIV